MWGILLHLISICVFLHRIFRVVWKYFVESKESCSFFISSNTLGFWLDFLLLFFLLILAFYQLMLSHIFLKFFLFSFWHSDSFYQVWIFLFCSPLFLFVSFIYISVALPHRTKLRCVWKKWVRRKETLKTWILRNKIVVALFLGDDSGL